MKTTCININDRLNYKMTFTLASTFYYFMSTNQLPTGLWSLLFRTCKFLFTLLNRSHACTIDRLENRHAHASLVGNRYVTDKRLRWIHVHTWPSSLVQFQVFRTIIYRAVIPLGWLRYGYAGWGRNSLHMLSLYMVMVARRLSSLRPLF